MDGEDDRRQEWLCSGWRPGAAGEQLGTNCGLGGGTMDKSAHYGSILTDEPFLILMH